MGGCRDVQRSCCGSYVDNISCKGADLARSHVPAEDEGRQSELMTNSAQARYCHIELTPLAEDSTAEKAEYSARTRDRDHADNSAACARSDGEYVVRRGLVAALGTTGVPDGS